MLNPNPVDATAAPFTPRASSPVSAGRIAAALREPAPRMLDLGHSKLAYWRFGTGPDIVFVHGWPLHAATFRGIVPLLADSFTCHLVDLPGAGQSSCTAQGKINVAAHAVTLRRAIEQLNLARYAFVAHDSGGLIARRAAADNPQVAGLVLSGTELPGHRPWLVRLLVAISKLPFGAWVVRSILKSSILRKSPFGLRAAFMDLAHLDGEFYDLFIAPLCASRAKLAAQLEHWRALDWEWIERLSETHAKIMAPIHLIWGTEDGFFPIERARRMVTQFPAGASFSEIARAKTFVHEERPQTFVEHARPFLLRTLCGEQAP